MTVFDTNFSLLKEEVDIPYQKVVDYINLFGHYIKTVSMPLCWQLPLPYVMCGDPESGTDHSQGGQCIHYSVQGAHRVHTWGLQGKMPQVILCALLCKLTNYIHVSVKNANAKGTCYYYN